MIFQNVGADGTRYAELAMMRENPTSVRKFAKVRALKVKNTVQATVYARIDHTIMAPELPDRELSTDR